MKTQLYRRIQDASLDLPTEQHKAAVLDDFSLQSFSDACLGKMPLERLQSLLARVETIVRVSQPCRVRKASRDLSAEQYIAVLDEFSLLSFSEARLGEMPLERLRSLLERIEALV